MPYDSAMIINILQVGGIACLLFTAVIVTVGLSGIADAIRDEHGNFRKEFNLKTVFGLLLMLFLILGMQIWGNLRCMQIREEPLGLMPLWINGFSIFMVLHLYDLIVLDYLIIVRWHPRFLKLPDTDYYTNLRPHFIGFIRGIPFGILLSLLASLVTICAW